MKNTILIIACLVLGVAFGYGFGYTRGGRDAQATPYPVKIGMYPSVTSTKVLNGVVKQVAGNTITIDKVFITQNPLLTNFPRTRDVVIMAETKITKVVLKDTASYQKEMKAFQSSLKPGSGKVYPTPPSPYVLKDIQLSDIKVGDILGVSATSDIFNVTSFTATQVQVVAPGV